VIVREPSIGTVLYAPDFFRSFNFAVFPVLVVVMSMVPIIIAARHGAEQDNVQDNVQRLAKGADHIGSSTG